ncbi:hypothetical protein BDP27DRAFT_1365555 [Rhodocollybia butyracea]|uniref:Uncharacterized protein n=1 Tax=Rhodocollybia butyracea TaxID=206335 RepID=A0A9P5PIY6_9AGAR|nr:hypothetical protein BDP27DRAFT_1365555 [Rhodocollybia butyracea]
MCKFTDACLLLLRHLNFLTIWVGRDPYDIRVIAVGTKVRTVFASKTRTDYTHKSMCPPHSSAAGKRQKIGCQGLKGQHKLGVFAKAVDEPLKHCDSASSDPFNYILKKSLLDQYKTGSAPEEMHEIEVECEELTDQICAILRASNPLEDAQIKDILIRVHGMRNMMTPPAQSDPKQKKWANLPPCDELRSAVYLAANGDLKARGSLLESVQSDIYFDMYLKP